MITNKHYKTAIAALLSTCFWGVSAAHGAINVTDPAFNYTQTFDALSASGTSGWTNGLTLSGWNLFRQPGTAISTYIAGDGSNNTGSFYSFGTTGSSERALGAIGSGSSYFGSPSTGSVAGWIAVAFQNGSATALKNFTVGFDGEQWRNGGNTSAQAMVLEWGYGSDFASVASWNAPGGNFDWSSPVTGASAGAVDGNAAGRVTGLGGMITTDWKPGDTLWLRWAERNDTGYDHGLAIDNFRFAASVPEAGTYGMMLAGLAVISLMARRSRPSIQA
jgi:hypothetical protein